MRRATVAPVGQGYSTRDYVRLHDPSHLDDYEVTLAAHAPSTSPFKGWNTTAPTQTLPWYDAYNKAKHDRAANLSQATVMRCIEAVAANVVLFCARFGPYALFQASTQLSAPVNQLLLIELVASDPQTFYVPLVSLPASSSNALVCGETQQFTEPWRIVPLVA